jgi:hypothetical protein
MSALITNPPVYVPSSGVYPQLYDTVQLLTGNYNFFGPFAVGATIYLVLQESVTVGAVVAVYSSSDNGATWTRQDAGHEPTQTLSSVVQAGSTLHIALSSAGDLFVITFNCLTNLWGALSGNAGVAGAIGTALTVQSNGTRFVFYTHSGVSGNLINLLQLTALNVWSGPTTIATAAAGTFNRLTGALIDGSAVSHVFWEHRSTGGTTNCKLQTIGVDNTGALVGVVTDISASAATIATIHSDSAAIPGANLALGLNGTYAQPVPWNPGLAGVVSDPKPYVVLGDPTDGWTTSTPDPLLLSIPAGCTTQVVECLGVGGMISAFWAVFDTAGLGTTDQIWQSSWNGAVWSTPQLLYDAVANPAPAPADAAAGQWPLSNWNAAILPSGGIGIALAFIVSSNPPATHGNAFPVFFAASLPTQSKTAQIAFVGVRRMKGKLPQVCPEYPNNPKSFTWILPVTLTSLVGGAVVTARQLITDYDFELYQIILLAQQGTHPTAPILKPVASLVLYDVNKVAISNLPVLDLFMDGCPGGVFKNGAIVTPLRYCKNSSIQLDVFSQIVDPSLLPTTLFIHLVGRKLIPC